MSGDQYLTLFQALQLVALGPTLFIMAFLMLATRNMARVAIPVLYFLTLAASFVMPLLTLFPVAQASALNGWLLWVESFWPALSFLLIVQLLMGRVPPPFFWLVLALPGIGGSLLVYGRAEGLDVCLTRDICVEAAALQSLYHVIGSAALLLFLMAYLGREEGRLLPETDALRAHKYWLIMALLFLMVSMLGVHLWHLAGKSHDMDAQMAATLLRIAFLYVALTSLFRVFERAVAIDFSRLPTAQRLMTPHYQEATQKLKLMMEEQKAYREMGLNRAELATRLGIGEHALSRIVNIHYGRNLSEFLNGYRVEEAKHRLRQEDVSVTVIAFETGFASIASFNRVFKQMTGRSPTEYRAQSRGEGSVPVAAAT